MVAFPLDSTIQHELADKRWALVPASAITPIRDFPAEWLTLAAEIPLLPLDEIHPNGGGTHYRRADRFMFEPLTGDLTLLPHERDLPHGGLALTSAPLTSEIAANPLLGALIRWDFAQLPIYDSGWLTGIWQVDVHVVRVTAKPGEVGSPTPQGIHRDGANFAAVHLLSLDNADGGFVTFYDDDKEPLETFRLNHVMQSYLFDDTSLWHGVTAIRPHDEDASASRSVMIFDFHFRG